MYVYIYIYIGRKFQVKSCLRSTKMTHFALFMFLPLYDARLNTRCGFDVNRLLLLNAEGLLSDNSKFPDEGDGVDCRNISFFHRLTT